MIRTGVASPAWAMAVLWSGWIQNGGPNLRRNKFCEIVRIVNQNLDSSSAPMIDSLPTQSVCVTNLVSNDGDLCFIF